ncbi:ankyrin repeat and LEM domain-containing protein 1 isoform X1 [Hylobates moloch]|uniref:ankyrin repeat and LEM domain-containing protein 1 isoform X1 n=1 Tax=Hylobates moloch TaxID=81572 RepID=UPI0013630390|nr:ankyrin repeat and LEM domain-containing protein 1 isoform X1 [Hylobates moloch]
MWTSVRRGAAWLGTLLGPGEGPPEPRGGAAHAHKPPAGSRKSTGQAVRFGPSQGMCSEARLARRLRAALREEEPWAVEELLRCGADPNLVLEDGAAAVHLAAGARHPRGLRCLGVLLRQGGDPNARSVEALTPLHVAAAWGCRRGLELLLSQGADPALRDQDGLRPLDLALQQGHLECARVLQDLDTRTGTRTPIGAETQEPETAPGTPGLSGPPDETLNSIALQKQPCRGDNRDMGLEADPGPPSLPVPLEIVDKDGSSVSPPGHWDSSSDASFVTAVEVSGAEDPASDTPPWAGSLPPTRQGLLHVVHANQRVPRSQGTEAELNARLQALTLTPPNAAWFQSSPSSMPLVDRSPSHSSPRTPPPGADCHCLWEHQTSIDSDMATLWLTEDEASSTGGRDPVGPCRQLPVSTVSDLESLQGLRALGPEFSGHSLELAAALRTGHIPDVQADEDALAQQFERPDPARRWREGVVKSSFTYLLLDPRETQDLPARAFSLTPAERLQTFIRAIFYVGKGTRARPYVHLWEALGHHGRSRKQPPQACPKVRQILDIWASGCGVVSLHCFQHMVAVEAYTREACIVEALGIQMLTNQKQGHCYGVVAGWPPARRRRLGVHLLHRALLVFLAEGERQLRPQDIQARG